MKLVLTDFGQEAMIIIIGLLILVLGVIIIYWLYNRKKFHELSHQIPASVVKNYLDSIIQNSTALKSSLFRGGGLELGQGIPSVLPVENLKRTTVTTGISEEELNQKNAEINRLKQQLSEKNGIIQDLETQLRSAGDPDASAKEIKKLQEEIVDLKKRLADAEKKAQEAKELGAKNVPNDEMQIKMNAITAERDELKERLMEYEIIEEDLANLKRLQQENEQLRKSLEALKGTGASAAAPALVEAAAASEVIAELEPEPEPEPEPELESEPEPAAQMPEDIAEPEPKTAASAEPEPAEEGAAPVAADSGKMAEDQKSAEELLSEFEKMLG